MYVGPHKGDMPFQGDIYSGIPFYVNTAHGERVGRADNPAMLISHECDVDKSNNAHALLAVVRPASDLNPGSVPNMRSGKMYNAFYLPDPPGLPAGDWYMDCRFITVVEIALLDPARRIASLDDAHREALQGKLKQFWARGNA